MNIMYLIPFLLYPLDAFNEDCTLSPSSVQKSSTENPVQAKRSLIKSNSSVERGWEHALNQSVTDARQERSLGITIISISILFVICQSVKIVPTFYEIFFCNPKLQNVESGEKPTRICETTEVIDKFIRYEGIVKIFNQHIQITLFIFIKE